MSTRCVDILNKLKPYTKTCIHRPASQAVYTGFFWIQITQIFNIFYKAK